MPDYAQLLTAARHAVAAACTICRTVQRNMDKVRAIVKDDRSPVTIADFAAQAIVGHILQERLGTIALVGEETSAHLRNPEHSRQLAATLAAIQDAWPDATEESLLDAIDLGAGDTHHAGFWTLDPIDGTRGFLRGQQYAVSLAFIEFGEVNVAAMGCPNLSTRFDDPFDQANPRGTMYLAIRNQGLSEVSPADDATANPILIRRPVRAEDQPISMCTSVEEAHADLARTADVLKLVGPTREPAQLDSQAKYAVVGRGQADVYMRLPTRADYREYIWDHAAGSLIATEAGCAATDIDGKLLDFSKGRRLTANRGILVGSPAEHGRFLGAIRQLGL